MNKTYQETFENANEYRQMLVKAIHSCAVKFPDVAHDVVHVLLDFIGDDDAESASEVVDFVREVTQTYPDLRQPIVTKVTLPPPNHSRQYLPFV
jgi:coatomer subunit beta